jgi:biotin carboxylase
MKLLAIEARQWGSYFVNRYNQIQDYGYDVYLLAGEGTPGSWPEERSRSLGSKRLGDIIEGARAWHAEERFDGVFSISEVAVVTAAHVAEALGLPGIGVEAALASRNKLLMHEAHERHGVPQARFRYVTSLEEARAAAEEFGYPAIIKPTLGAASTFVFRVDTPEELEQRYQDAAEGIREMAFRTFEADDLELGPHGLLVESFLDGSEHLIEAAVWDDEVFLGSIVDRVTVEGNTFDDDVHHAPTTLTEEQIAEAYEVVAAATRSQGLRRSAMHAEIRYHEGKPHILEIAARPGGGGLDFIARITADHCPLRTVAEVALGRKPPLHHFKPTGVHCAALCVICPPGVVEEIVIPPEVSDSPRTFLLKITAKPGDVIRRPPEGNSIVGFLGTTGSSYEDAMDTTIKFTEMIDVRLRPREPAPV